MNSISIIIPVLNEAASINKLLNHLLVNSSPSIIHELIIVDGGSRDLTRDIVCAFFQKTIIGKQKIKEKKETIKVKDKPPHAPVSTHSSPKDPPEIK